MVQLRFGGSTIHRRVAIDDRRCRHTLTNQLQKIALSDLIRLLVCRTVVQQGLSAERGRAALQAAAADFHGRHK